MPAPWSPSPAEAEPRVSVHLTINGEEHARAIPCSRLLLDLLREDLALTGSKRGCDDSSCGACTILVDGTPMLSCTLLAAACDRAHITTIEGIKEGGLLSALQRSFGAIGGAQCGYCTPGMVMAAKAILDRNPHPSDEEIRAGLSGNICRCTGYNQIFASVRAAIVLAGGSSAGEKAPGCEEAGNHGR